MKKLTAFLIAASLVTFALSSAVCAAESQNDAAASILAQTQAAKAANKAKAEAVNAQQKTDNKAADKKQDTTQKNTTAKSNIPAVSAPNASANTSAQNAKPTSAKTDTAQSAETETSGKTNPAASVVDQIVKEASQNASKEADNASNNKGAVARQTPTKTDKDIKTDKDAKTAPTSTNKTNEKAAEKPAAEKQSPKATQLSGDAQATTSVAPAQLPQQTSSELAAMQGRPLNPSAMDPGPEETEKTTLVSAEWLKANILKTVVIDARDSSLYKGGHIPGAVSAQWQYFANMSGANGTEKWGTKLPAATMAKRIGALGVNGKKPVVVYCDAGGWGQSGWVLWIFRQAGIKNAKMLEGGLSAWKKIGGKVVKTATSNKPVSFTIKSYLPNYDTTTKWLNDNLGKPGLVVLDVRTEPEYLGKIRPFQEKRAGHIPGAINIPREEFLDKDDGSIESEQKVVAMLAAKGITPENEIVVYDTAGVRGAFVTMVLRVCGFTKTQNYDSGFQAWAGNPDLPLVKP
ncbi:MAG: rhodanese-like domain-containing protein [Synergistes sp.]|nr:rhodanese-like domain-containing protein [Synergistes sp.]